MGGSCAAWQPKIIAQAEHACENYTPDRVSVEHGGNLKESGVDDSDLEEQSTTPTARTRAPANLCDDKGRHKGWGYPGGQGDASRVDVGALKLVVGIVEQPMDLHTYSCEGEEG